MCAGFHHAASVRKTVHMPKFSGFQMTIGVRFLTVIAIAVAIMSAGTIFAIYQFREAMIELRQGQVRSEIGRAHV
mgnify:FL=1